MSKTGKIAFIVICILLVASWGFIGAGLFPQERPAPSADVPAPLDLEEREGDRELAYLLVKLVRKTRAVIAGHYTGHQSDLPFVDTAHRRRLAQNRVLPAAVADPIFSKVVPHATGGRAWVKMVVPEPRNPNNRGDETSLALLEKIRAGGPAAEMEFGGAYYYGEAITAKKTCLPCHGEPKGARDPAFPEYEKDGWKEGDIIGAVIARVEPKKEPAGTN
ncbi:MAG: Tll0287-like domain-containing protein [Planctomycetota bacterium]|jgi:hypothetical protein